MGHLMLFSDLALVTPKISPIFDFKLVIELPLGLLRMFPLLTDNLNFVSLCMSNAPASDTEVIFGFVGFVGVGIYRMPTIK